jgi:CubicO group peptidase (beta-lactamase class C family)
MAPTDQFRVAGRLRIGVMLMVIFMFGLVSCQPSGNKSEISSNRSGATGVTIEKLHDAAAYAGGSGMVMRGSKIVYQWGDINKRHDLKSTTKSIGVMALGLAIEDGLIGLNDNITDHCPRLDAPSVENTAAGWVNRLTFLHLATHTGGFDKPGGHVPMLYEPGTAWAYSDGGTNHLADCLTVLFGRDLKQLLNDRVFTPIGISPSDLQWRDNHYREPSIEGIARRELGSGIHANVKAMAAIGRLFLLGGMWDGNQIISKNFIDRVRKPIPAVAALPVKNDKSSEFADASKQYGLLWWNNGEGTMAAVPKDSFWAWGLHDSIILVVPSLDLVAVRAGETIEGARSPDHFKILEPFFARIAMSVNHGAPYPNSGLIANVVWEDASNIIRKAEGSDTWPITWADDGYLYTAFADGWGFKPKTPEKLSLGFAKVAGLPPDIEGTNIRSAAEQYGDGRKGKKASGMLMVNGVLYMWVRNADNDGNHSRLAWSDDYGKTWSWSPWVFEAFGYCTFINYGRNYEGARDDFVYIVTHDNPSAYAPADRFVLMRVHKKRIRDRGAYEFFEGMDSEGTASWTVDIGKRGAIFEHGGNCFRSGISYNAGLGRYVWWQVKIPENGYDAHAVFRTRATDPRYVGAFGVFEAPEPWGPWTTLFYTYDWDAGAGETGSFPTKWMSEDGRTMHLVFSGDDYFSVRKADLVISPDAQRR